MRRAAPRRVWIVLAAAACLTGLSGSVEGRAGLAEAPLDSSVDVQDECAPPVRVDVESVTGPASWARAVSWWSEPGLEPAVRLLARHGPVFEDMPGIGTLAETLETPPAVYLLRDLACLDRHGLAGAVPDWVAGVADTDGRFVALRADPSRDPAGTLRIVLRHELAHVALRSATNGNVPRWLNEGYAQYASGSWDWQEAWRLRLTVLAEGRGVLNSLSLRFPGTREGARLAYMFSYTAVHQLAGLSGEGGLQALFGRLASGASLDQALRSVFGLTEGQFEDMWRRSVARRYGVLYVLSRATLFWTVLTILLVWLGRRRKKRNRARLERLREDERRAEELADAGAQAGEDVDGGPSGSWRTKWPLRREDYRP